jgi:hypothetical protein
MDDPTNIDGTYPFAGLTRYNDGDLPERVLDHGSSVRWWASETFGTDEPIERDLPEEGLNTMIDSLPRAAEAAAGWKHPVTGDWIETGKHNAIIEPSVAEQIEGRTGTKEQVEGFGGDPDETVYGDRALFNIPTDDYSIINPATFLRPLTEVLRDEGLDDAVFGEFRVSRGGGRVSADVFFDGKHVEAPGMDEDRKPIVVGLQLDWDFFGGTALRMRGMGMDWECVNSIRQITEGKTIKHAGDVNERVEWVEMYEDLLEELDLKTDQLSRVIHEASEETLDLSDFPDGFADDYDTVLEAFYAYAGLPDYLAEVAADNARANAEDPFNPDWWTLHRGATYAISHEARGEVGTGAAIDQYNRRANDLLMNPAGVADDVEAAYEEAHEETTLAEEGGGQVTMDTAFESVRDKRDRYEEREEEIHSLIEG